MLKKTDECPDDASSFIARKLCDWGIKINFDGSVRVEGHIQTAETPAEIPEALRNRPKSLQQVLDEILLAGRGAYKASELKTAFRLHVSWIAVERFVTVMTPLMGAGQILFPANVEQEWMRLDSLFEMPPGLPTVVLKSFIWSVKQKAIGRRVTWHMMPIIYSPIQGGGKTSFVRQFAAPLQDLVADGTLFSDLADRRSGDIFRYAVLIIDDMEWIPKALVPILKTVLTAITLRRRRLGTSNSDAIPQQTMPIGTSNRAIDELVQDGTGNRRFVMMPFRNGDIVKGGSADVWETVNTLNYSLLWESVDPFGPNPIIAHLDRVQDHQIRVMPASPLLLWLKELDLESEAARNTIVDGVFRSDRLMDLFMAQSGQEITKNRFATDMILSFAREECPFGAKGRDANGVYYRLKSAPK